jgi:hypothetical protein
MITLSLADDVARLVYDELQGRLEYLGVDGDMDERDPADISVRVYRAIETALNALDAAGSGPSPLGTYGPLR